MPKKLTFSQGEGLNPRKRNQGQAMREVIRVIMRVDEHSDHIFKLRNGESYTGSAQWDKCLSAKYLVEVEPSLDKLGTLVEIGKQLDTVVRGAGFPVIGTRFGDHVLEHDS